MFRILTIIYLILSAVSFFMIFSSTAFIYAFVVSISNVIIFSKLDDMQDNIARIKTKLGIKDEEKPKTPEEDDDD